MAKYFKSLLQIIAISISLILLSFSAIAATKQNLVRVNMSSHIIESSIANLKDTVWTLYKSTAITGSDKDTNSKLISKKIQTFNGAIKSILLQPGNYILRIQYGHAVHIRIFSVDPKVTGRFLNLKIIFKLGALKLSSTIGNNPKPVSAGVTYVIRNIKSGKIVLETSDVSKTYYLNKGDYNVTAHFKDIITTDAKITILPNNLNNVIIQHKVGKIDLNIDNVKSSIKDIPPTWRIVGAKNQVDKEIVTTENTSILLPSGDYQLIIEWNDYIYTREFSMHPAEIIEFKLPKES